MQNRDQKNGLLLKVRVEKGKVEKYSLAKVVLLKEVIHQRVYKEQRLVLRK
jgi:hypothetical protein